jgi:hypothetical protein
MISTERSYEGQRCTEHRGIGNNLNPLVQQTARQNIVKCLSLSVQKTGPE